jgi:preprotein translocase subunit SecG
MGGRYERINYIWEGVMKEMKNFMGKCQRNMLAMIALFMCVSICLGYLPKKNNEKESGDSNPIGLGARFQEEQAKEDKEDNDELLTDEDRFMATEEGAKASDTMDRTLLDDLAADN